MNKFRFMSCVVVAMIAFSLQAQVIPNAGFETWSGGSPTGWATSNAASLWTTVTQSGTVHGGTFALDELRLLHC